MKKRKWLSALLSAAMVLTLIPATAFAAGTDTATITIGEQTYTTLQEALGEAKDGDTITISEGTVTATGNEQFRISTNNLIIQGAGAGTVIDAGTYSVSGQAGVLVEADGVTIQDCSIVSSSTDPNVSALKFSKIGTVNELPMISSGTVNNVTISSEKGHALNIHGVTAMTVNGLTVNKAGKCGISIASAPSVQVSNTQIGETGWGSDIAVMYKDSAAYQKASSVVLGSGNDFGETTVIYSERPAAANEGADKITASADSGLVIVPDSTGAWVVTSDRAEDPAPVENTTTGLRYMDLESALQAANNGDVIKLLDNVTLDRMLNIEGKQNLTVNLNGKTITASSAFTGTYDNDKHLVQVFNSENITIANGTLKTTSSNKHTLNVYSSKGVKLEGVTLDHEAAFTGAPMVVNNSDVTVSGDFKVVTGKNSWYGVNLDNKYGETTLTFAEDSTIAFDDKSGEGLDLIFVEDTNADESVPAPSVTNHSDKILFDEDGTSFNPHTHIASAERQGVLEATCTKEGYTGDIVCTVCGEILDKGQTVAKTAHSYQEGKCTVCGALDPDYETAGSGDDSSTTTEGTDGNDKTPKTGDSSLALWLILMFASMGGLTGTAIFVKKHRAR